MTPALWWWRYDKLWTLWRLRDWRKVRTALIPGLRRAVAVEFARCDSDQWRNIRRRVLSQVQVLRCFIASSSDALAPATATRRRRHAKVGQLEIIACALLSYSLSSRRRRWYLFFDRVGAWRSIRLVAVRHRMIGRSTAKEIKRPSTCSYTSWCTSLVREHRRCSGYFRRLSAALAVVDEWRLSAQVDFAAQSTFIWLSDHWLSVSGILVAGRRQCFISVTCEVYSALAVAVVVAARPLRACNVNEVSGRRDRWPTSVGRRRTPSADRSTPTAPRPVPAWHPAGCRRPVLLSSTCRRVF